MKSGIGDFDLPTYEKRVFANEKVHNPLEDLQQVANYTAEMGCETKNCTWLFNPGKRSSYSSINYLLA